MTVGNNKTIIFLLCLFASLLLIFGDVVGYSFLKFDDEQYVTKNVHVLAGLTWGGLKWAFTTTDAGFWQPLVWLSHMLDYELYGLHAGGHHLSGLLLHIANTLLLFLVLRYMTHAAGKSAFVAALFGIHPLHVETVVWIADRKDLLCTLFWLMTMGAYLFYLKRPNFIRYLPILMFFSLGLMSKPMIVTLPIVLLLLDYWPLQRTVGCRWGDWRRALLEKIPLVLLTLPVIGLTFLAEGQAQALPSHEAFPFSLRLTNALVNYVQYLWLTFYPVKLAIFYPQPNIFPIWQPLLAAFVMGALLIISIRLCRSHPFFITGWLWYLVSLFPVCGIVQIGSHVRADRYTYIPLIGIFIVMVWGVANGAARLNIRRTLAWLAIVWMIWLMKLSWHQTQTWRDTESVFLHALTATNDNYLAHNNLGVLRMEQGRVEEAIRHYRQAVSIKPHFMIAVNNLGNALITKGDIDTGLQYYRKIPESDQIYWTARRNLADGLMKRGDFFEAIVIYQDLLKRSAADPELHNNLGVALVHAGQKKEGIVYIRRALSLEPGYETARNNLKRIENEDSVDGK